MTLKEIVDLIALSASSQPNVHQIVDAFEKLNVEDAEYASFVIQQTEHNPQTGEYGFYLGYVDRLNSSGSNDIDIQSIGIDAIMNVANTLYNNDDINDVRVGRTIPLVHKFIAECAVVYASVVVVVPVSDCAFQY